MGEFDNFKDVMATLESKSRVVYQPPRSDPSIIKPALAAAGIACETQRLDVGAYEEWRRRIDYESNYPKYVKEFPVGPLLYKKSLEHFVSLLLAPPEPSDTYMDVASSNSVVPDILARHYQLKSIYRQDLRYPSGLHGWKIGSNASSIPLPDASIDNAALHCSIEHFENNADTAFVREAGRLLRPGGKVCVTPLYLAEEYYISTSRWAWEKQGIPVFDPKATICISDKHKLKYSKHFDAHELSEQMLRPAEEVGLDWRIIHFENWRDLPRIPVFTLLLTKKG